MKEFILGQKSNFVSKDQEASILDDFMIYILFGVVFVLVMLIMLILKVVRKYRDKISKKLNDIKKKMLWNGIIRSQLITYVVTLKTSGT